MANRVNEWQQRRERAQELAGRYAFAAEILRFYLTVGQFQEKLRQNVEGSDWVRSASACSNPFQMPPDRKIARDFRALIAVVEENGPPKLQGAARELRATSDDLQFEMLTSFWLGDGTMAQTSEFFARACLQPYAAVVRERANLRWNGPTAYACPFCKRKPGVGVLRPLGDGGQRSLVCSFCLGEWEFRRILCPACGEGDPAKLPVYAAEELQHVRVEGCDSCKCYIKTVDLTRSGLGDPVVDEIASVPLDLWAQAQGYKKLQANLMQF